MVGTKSVEIQAKTESKNEVYDKKSELKAFDDTKAGVKGLVDAGLAQGPPIFMREEIILHQISANISQLSIPIIDLQGIRRDPISHNEIVDGVREASEKWDFFQLINHGIPISVLDKLKNGIGKERVLFQRFQRRRFIICPILHCMKLHQLVGKIRLLALWLLNHPIQKHCQMFAEIMMEYKGHVMRLALTALELLSEALGLNSSHLKDMDRAESILFLGYYYPALPEPELTLGADKHTDSSFITALPNWRLPGSSSKSMEPPIDAVLVVNIGDFLQLISNDKFISATHRVLVKNVGPRISVACAGVSENSSKVHVSIRELLSDDNPPIYRETDMNEYRRILFSKGLDGTSPVLHFKL